MFLSRATGGLKLGDGQKTTFRTFKFSFEPADENDNSTLDGANGIVKLSGVLGFAKGVFDGTLRIYINGASYQAFSFGSSGSALSLPFNISTPFSTDVEFRLDIIGGPVQLDMYQAEISVL